MAGYFGVLFGPARVLVVGGFRDERARRRRLLALLGQVLGARVGRDGALGEHQVGGGSMRRGLMGHAAQHGLLVAFVVVVFAQLGRVEVVVVAVVAQLVVVVVIVVVVVGYVADALPAVV